MLATRGARVAVAARRLDALAELVQKIIRDGGSAFATSLDVRDEGSIIRAVTEIEKSFGPIDILVNNSGVGIVKSALEQTADDWDAVLSVNLRGAFLVAREVAKSMRDRRTGGNIINIASILAERQQGAILPYAVSKAGLVQMTKSLALELARFDIRVNAIAPGYILTDINRSYFGSEAGGALIKRIPQRRIGNESDLDGALLLLASAGSSFMTGSVVAVDGGHLVSSL